MKNYNIGICGFGYVGKAIYSLVNESKNMSNTSIHIYDPYSALSIKNNYNINSSNKFKHVDIAFVCVPTPPCSDGKCDWELVEESVKWIDADLIVIKSTVPVGTCDLLSEKYNKKIVFSPEYCGESKYWTPYEFHEEIVETPFFIFGGDKKLTQLAIDFFLLICGPTKKYIQCEAQEAEMAKYMENTFFASKIAFCNEIYSICEANNINWHAARELWLLDPRINPMHTAVFKNDRGFGGKCLPKDLKELISLSDRSGVECPLLKSIQKSNDLIRHSK